ncbi:unnamed protein product, partial [Urochloa humidicola]
PFQYSSQSTEGSVLAAAGLRGAAGEARRGAGRAQPSRARAASQVAGGRGSPGGAAAGGKVAARPAGQVCRHRLRCTASARFCFCFRPACCYLMLAT